MLQGLTMRPAQSLVLILFTACVTQPDEGQAQQALVGGTTASTATYKTLVGLQHGNGNWFCTGTLIDKDYVLTSASCFDQDSDKTTQVRFDDDDISNDSGGIVVTVSEVHKHPEYSTNSTMWNHDVAILKLATSVTDRTPTGIHREAAPIGTSVMQVGFGRNSNNGGGGKLRSLSTSNLDCGQVGDGAIVNDNDLCFDANDGTGSCSGDGGAPAFMGSEVAAVASGGTDNSCTDGYDIYTSLAAELTFIDTFVTPPTPTDPTTPPDDTGDPTDTGGPRHPGGDDTGSGRHPPAAMGCNAGGASGFGALLGLALLAVVRPRRRR